MPDLTTITAEYRQRMQDADPKGFTLISIFDDADIEALRRAAAITVVFQAFGMTVEGADTTTLTALRDASTTLAQLADEIETKRRRP